MEKQGKKRPAGVGDDKLGKHAKPRPNEEEMEEFYALIRRIRSTSKLADKQKGSQSPIFQWEDFVASSLNGEAGNAAAVGEAAAGCGGGSGGGGEKELSAGRSSEDDEGKSVDDEEEEGAKGEGVEDNGLPRWLDLNLDLAAAKSSC